MGNLYKPVLFFLISVILAANLQSAEWEQLLDQADSVSTAGYHDSAAVIAFQGLKQVEREFGPKDTVVARVLKTIGTFYNRCAAFSKSEPLLRRSLLIRESVLGPDHPDVATSLLALGAACRGLAKFDEAESCYQRCLEIREKTLGRKHADVAQVLFGLGLLRGGHGKEKEAEAFLTEALEIYESLGGTERREVGDILVMLASNCTGHMRLKEADTLFARALAILEPILGPDHPDMAQPYRSAGMCSGMLGQFARGDSLCLKAQAIDERVHGPVHEMVARDLCARALISTIKGNMNEASQIADHAIEILQEVSEPPHTHLCQALNVRSVIYRNVGKHAEADSLARLAMDIKNEIYADESLNRATGMVMLATTCTELGKYAEADSLYVEAISIMDSVGEPTSHSLAWALSNYSGMLTRQGGYSEAEPLLERALAICDRPEVSDRLQVSATLNLIANLRLLEGRLEESESLQRQSLSVVEDAYGKDHLQAARILQSLSMVNVLMSDYAEAEQYAERALAILEKTAGPAHEDVGGILNIYGVLAVRRGKYNEAADYFQRGLAIRQKALGPEHPDCAKYLDNIATIYALQGKPDEAERLLDKAHALVVAAFGAEHPEVAEGLEAYATTLGLEGRWPEALEKSREAFRIRRKTFEDNGLSLLETDALMFAGKVRGAADRHVSCYLDSRTNDPEESRKTIEVVLLSKGQVSDMIFERRRPLLEETDPEIIAMADSLQSVRAQLSALFVNGPGQDSVSNYRNRIDSLRSLADDVESDLVVISDSFRKQRERREVSLERVLSSLPKEAVLVEYFKYDHAIAQTDSLEPRYAVGIISHDSPPAIIALGKAASIETAIDAYRRHMLHVSGLREGPGVFDLEDYRAVCSPLYELVWRPVEKYTSSKELVLIAPDGGLNMVSFAGLADKDNRYLIEDHTIHYLSSGRDLIRLAEDRSPASGLFALGDPDYDAVRAELGPESSNGQVRTRSVRSSCSGFSDLNVSALPGTRKEVEQLVTTWQNNTEEAVTAYYGQEATEERFKSLSPGHRIVHLATHGYFMEAECNPDVPVRGIGSAPGFAGENPLLLSGLLLAGANRTGSDSVDAGGEDGILTAYEVASMNMGRTELVVLSACETGLGEVKSGEGVYGLRRAFQMAGVSSVISALWPISDEATAEMMSRLYVGGTESLAAGMRAIQIEKLRDLRDAGDTDHPYNWAAFVAVGDWRW